MFSITHINKIYMNSSPIIVKGAYLVSKRTFAVDNLYKGCGVGAPGKLQFTIMLLQLGRYFFFFLIKQLGRYLPLHISLRGIKTILTLHSNLSQVYCPISASMMHFLLTFIFNSYISYPLTVNKSISVTVTSLALSN
jgi:hypothetical protein